MSGQRAGARPERDATWTYDSILAELRFAQKPGHGVPAYTRWVNRGLARGVAARCATWGWSANLVSAVSAVVSFAALLLLLLLPPHPTTGFLVAVLLATGYLLDSADGQVARVTGTGSMAGEWLDHVIDAARTPAIHLGVAAGFVHMYGPGAWQWSIPLLYCVVSASHFMSQILAEQLLRPTRIKFPQPEDRRSGQQPISGRSTARSFVMLHTDTGIICWMFIAWGFPPLFLMLYVLMFAANTVTATISLVRKFRSLQTVGGRLQ